MFDFSYSAVHGLCVMLQNMLCCDCDGRRRDRHRTKCKRVTMEPKLIGISSLGGENGMLRDDDGDECGWTIFSNRTQCSASFERTEERSYVVENVRVGVSVNL